MSTLTSSSYQSARHPHHPHYHQHHAHTRDTRFAGRNSHNLLSESSSSSSIHNRRQSIYPHSLHPEESAPAKASALHCPQCPSAVATTTHLTRYPVPELPCDLTRSNHSSSNHNGARSANLRNPAATFHSNHHSSSHTSNHVEASSHLPRSHVDLTSSPTTTTPRHLSYPSFYSFKKKTPKRYFNLGLFCCCTAGFVFTLGLVLMVWGSSPHEPNAIWISGIVFLFTGGFLFFLGIGSIGLYLSREDSRKKKEEIERTRARQYAASLSSVRSLTRSSDIYLID